MITAEQVAAFKTRYCDENERIAELLRTRFAHRLADPLVDVGAGLGDISRVAFPDREVVLVDVLDYSAAPAAPNHRRVISDFFDLEATVGTLLLCHVLQFLDNDPARLAAKVIELAPAYVVTVTNDNDGVMGEIVAWALANLERANPEVRIPGFPLGYSVIDEAPFSATLACPDFATLTEQVSYLLDVDRFSSPGIDLDAFLRDHLERPVVAIHQRITLHGANDRQSRAAV